MVDRQVSPRFLWFRFVVISLCFLVPLVSNESARAQVASHQKISDTEGGFTGVLDDRDAFGWSVAWLGDVDGDGIGDLAVGAPFDDDNASMIVGLDFGAVWILFLNADRTVRESQKISDVSGGFNGELSEPGSFGGGRFGSSVEGLGDLNGDGVPDLLVGAPHFQDSGSLLGSIWILFLNRDGHVTSHRRYVHPGPANPSPVFGWSVSNIGDLDGNGVVDIAVGSISEDSFQGAVRILFLSGNGSIVGNQRISKNRGGFSGSIDDGDNFGSSVCAVGDLDGDGITEIAVGAVSDDDGGPHNLSDRGAVWVLFMKRDGRVAHHQKISDTEGGFTGTLVDDDSFGRSVSPVGDIDGDGTPDLLVGGVDFTHGATGTMWLLLLNSDGTVKEQERISEMAGGFTGMLDFGDNFGSAISFTNDASPMLAVGAPSDDDGGDRHGAAWLLSLDECQSREVELQKLLADDADGFSYFGTSVAIDGDTMVVGMPRARDSADPGSAYVFQRTNNQWSQVQKLRGSGPSSISHFGDSVSISNGTIVVGAPHTGGFGRPGSFFIFARVGPSTWEQTRFFAGNAPDSLGESVSLHGDTLAVGAPRARVGGISTGAAYIFEKNQGGPGNWGFLKRLLRGGGGSFGVDVSIYDDTIIVGNLGDATLFERDKGGPNNWGEAARFNEGGGGGYGRSVDVNSDSAFVSWLHREVYIYDRNRGGPDNWGLAQIVGPCGDLGAHAFGMALSATTDKLVVSSTTPEFPNPTGIFGYAFVYERNDAEMWSLSRVLAPSDPFIIGEFGYSVAIDDETIVVGKTNDGRFGSFTGSVYVYPVGSSSSDPPVSIALSDRSGTGVIDPCEILDLEVRVTNNRDQLQVIDVWLEAFLPGGAPYVNNPLSINIDLHVAANEDIVRRIQFEVPENLPVGSGSYEFRVNLGSFPGVLEETDSVLLIARGGLRGAVLFEDLKTPVRVMNGPHVSVAALRHGTLNGPAVSVGDDGTYSFCAGVLIEGEYDLVAVYEIPEQFRDTTPNSPYVFQPFDTDVGPDIIVDADGVVSPGRRDIIFPWPVLMLHGLIPLASTSGQDHFSTLQSYFSIASPRELHDQTTIRNGLIPIVPVLGDVRETYFDYYCQLTGIWHGDSDEFCGNPSPILDEILALFPESTRFNVVGYSQGGLVARMLVHDAGAGMISDFGSNRIIRVVQVATPNRGSCVAENVPRFKLCQQSLVDFASRFNKGHGIPFYLAAGRFYEALDFLAGSNFCLRPNIIDSCNYTSGPISDSIVSIDSVFSLESLGDYLVRSRTIVCASHFNIMDDIDNIVMPLHELLSE